MDRCRQAGECDARSGPERAVQSPLPPVGHDDKLTCLALKSNDAFFK
jgi:hypothetical protein